MKKIKDFIKKNKNISIIVGISLILFMILTILVILGKMDYIDTLMHSYVLNIRNDSLTDIFKVITNLAGASFLLAVSILLFIIKKNKKVSLYVFINLISAFIINEITKSIFTRSRPAGINLINETGFSFPSGHSMVALSFYGFIVYLLFKKTKSKLIKSILVVSLILIVLLVGFSRIYLGVHYLSDVIGGILLSIIYVALFIKFIKVEKV